MTDDRRKHNRGGLRRRWEPVRWLLILIIATVLWAIWFYGVR